MGQPGWWTVGQQANPQATASLEGLAKVSAFPQQHEAFDGLGNNQVRSPKCDAGNLVSVCRLTDILESP